MGNWTNGRQGWDGVDDYDNKGNFTGRKDADIAWSFFVEPDTTKRIMFLDSAPFMFYEHSGFLIGSKEKFVCLEKNSIDKRGCPLCDHRVTRGGKEQNMYASFIGYFSVIDMGTVVNGANGEELVGWESNRGKVYQFNRKVLGAKRGSNDKPGILKQIHRLANKRGGDLAGTVWDVYRGGKKDAACGNEWEFVKRVDRDNWDKYLVSCGANAEELILNPVDYDKQFQPKTYEELQDIVRNSGGYGGYNDGGYNDGGGNNWQSGSDGAGYNDSNDGIPF